MKQGFLKAAISSPSSPSGTILFHETKQTLRTSVRWTSIHFSSGIAKGGQPFAGVRGKQAWGACIPRKPPFLSFCAPQAAREKGKEPGDTPIGADFRPRRPPFGAEPVGVGASV